MRNFRNIKGLVLLICATCCCSQTAFAGHMFGHPFDARVSMQGRIAYFLGIESFKNLQVDEQSDSVFLGSTASIVATLDGSATSTWDVFDGSTQMNAHAQIDMKYNGYIKADDWGVAVEAELSLDLTGDALARAALLQSLSILEFQGSYVSHDFFSLSATGIANLPFNFTGQFYLHGIYTGMYTNMSNSTSGGGSVGVSLNSATHQFNIGSSTFGVNAALTAVSNYNFGANLAPVDQSIQFNFLKYLDSGETRIINSWRSPNTFTVTAITFADGTTPESHGIDLIFASGRTSPNLINNDPPPTAPEVVPEPSSCVLLGIGCVALCGYGWRRKRTAA